MAKINATQNKSYFNTSVHVQRLASEIPPMTLKVMNETEKNKNFWEKHVKMK